MHLLRVQIPDFRVLKDVDITFEKEFSPRIFPLGSQNGGGKSTMVQTTISPFPLFQNIKLLEEKFPDLRKKFFHYKNLTTA